MPAYDITPKGNNVKMRYDECKAILTIDFEGVRSELDEDDCDKLLRVIECAYDPCADLDEFFADEFPRGHWLVAVAYYEYAAAIAKHVYVA